MCDEKSTHELKKAVLKFIDVEPEKDLTRRQRRCIQAAQRLLGYIELLEATGFADESEEAELDLGELFEAMADLERAGILKSAISPKNMGLMKRMLQSVKEESESLALKAFRKKNQARFLDGDAEIDLEKAEQERLEKLREKIGG